MAFAKQGHFFHVMKHEMDQWANIVRSKNNHFVVNCNVQEQSLCLGGLVNLQVKCHAQSLTVCTIHEWLVEDREDLVYFHRKMDSIVKEMKEHIVLCTCVGPDHGALLLSLDELFFGDSDSDTNSSSDMDGR